MSTPMRVAFTSCMYAPMFGDQPVWDWIAAHAPDHLVLLGDTTYFDQELPGQVRVDEMLEDPFAIHAWRRYLAQVEQPQFKALVSSATGPRVHAIWDDHDFLWDNACGAETGIRDGQPEKVRYSAALLEAFRRALDQRLAVDSFPEYHDAALWFPDQGPPATPSVQLAPDVFLHLSDGRTFRTRDRLLRESKRVLLGEAQRAAFAQVIQAAPAALHLFASGSTFAGWQRYPADRQWLRALAAQHRILMLSGDVHANDRDEFRNGAGEFPLQEATSSGAAVCDLVVVGERRRNFGLLDIDDTSVIVRLFTDNVEDTPRVIDRATWTF